MPVKKSTKSTPAKKPARGKKPVGLTSALGPKVTTMIVIGVMAGGIAVAARQQQARVKGPAIESEVQLTPDGSVKVMPMSTSAAATNAPAAVARTASMPKGPSVTITGCLEAADGAFRLKDTGGTDAPKSRSWKSGFLKKGAAPVAVVDASNGVNLSSHAGQRVAITGTLIDREMRADSLRRVAASCKAG